MTHKLPENFKYREVYLTGRPVHGVLDPFEQRHPKMDLGKRAKIFAPFSALRGFDGEVASKEVPYVEKAELSAEDAAVLSRRLQLLYQRTRNSRMVRSQPVTVTASFFVPCSDPNSSAYGLLGQYRTVTGVCRLVDPEERRVLRIDDTWISFDDLLRLSLNPS